MAALSCYAVLIIYEVVIRFTGYDKSSGYLQDSWNISNFEAISCNADPWRPDLLMCVLVLIMYPAIYSVVRKIMDGSSNCGHLVVRYVVYCLSGCLALIILWGSAVLVIRVVENRIVVASARHNAVFNPDPRWLYEIVSYLTEHQLVAVNGIVIWIGYYWWLICVDSLNRKHAVAVFVACSTICLLVASLVRHLVCLLI